MPSSACVNQIAKEHLLRTKYSNKFLGSLNDVANEFLVFLTEEANKVTLQKGKSKMVPDDIFRVLETLDFDPNTINDFKAKTKEYEDSENVG